MNEEQRKKVFEHVYALADRYGYMAMDTSTSTAFQDDLENDSILKGLAGELLTRKYIKDTILNKYSKDRRYIVPTDIVEVISGIAEQNVVGTKADLENGIFHILIEGKRIRCTSVSLDQWETSLKRFGKKDKSEVRIAFLTCGGVQREESEIAGIKEALESYDVLPLIVRPNQNPVDITQIIPSLHDVTASLEVENFNLEKLISDLREISLIQDSTSAKRFVSALMSKRFCLLTGLAGSGKTKIAEAFAQWICHGDSQYKLIAVGADWTNNENLLGYSDAIQPGIYRTPNNGVLDLILLAQEDSQNPYFLILDEMNLSHVERYFADFLSAMESASGVISLHGESGKLKAGDMEVPPTIKLPDNLFIIGTVNIDETTYMFSPKVLDRANVIEFRASADQMTAFLDNPAPINLDSLTAKGTAFASSFVNRAREEATLVGVVDGTIGDIATRLKNDLIEIFSPLADVGAEFGFRTAKEIARFVAIHRELSGDDWNYVDALDAQVVQKLMPKLHGSARKLDAVLKALHKFASEKNLPLTKEKVERMQERLKRDGFTSFAEA